MSSRNKIEKIFFDNDTTKLSYIAENKRKYEYDISSFIQLISAGEELKYDNMVDVRDPDNVISYIAPSPYAMTSISARGQPGFVIYAGGEGKDIHYEGVRYLITRVHVSNADNLFMVTEKSVVRMKSDCSVIETIETFNNPGGLIAENKDKRSRNVIVMLGINKGDIVIYKFSKSLSSHERTRLEIHAHENNINSIAISRDGQTVATSSECGTNVNIYNADTGRLIRSFKRGLLSRKIIDMCFNWEGNVLACVSETGTVHFFDITGVGNARLNMLGMFASLLPSSIMDMQWAEKTVNVDISSTKAVGEFSQNGIYHLVTYDGRYFKIPISRVVSDVFSLQTD